jgi:hypothetical protein
MDAEKQTDIENELQQAEERLGQLDTNIRALQAEKADLKDMYNKIKSFLEINKE